MFWKVFLKSIAVFKREGTNASDISDPNAFSISILPFYQGQTGSSKSPLHFCICSGKNKQTKPVQAST